MKTMILALAASTLLASPVLAQSQGTDTTGQTASQSGSQTTGQAGSQSGAATAQTQEQTGKSGGCAARRQAMGRTQQGEGRDIPEATLTSAEDVKEALQKNGLSGVEVLQASYVVEATAPNGDCAVMIIDASRRGAGSMAGARAHGQAGADAQQQAQTGGEGQTGSQARTGTAGQQQAEAGSGSDASDSTGEAGSMTERDRAAGSEMTSDQRRQEGETFAAKLKEAGYSDIRVIEAAFGATAQLEGGEPVMLMIEGTPAKTDGSTSN